MLKVNLRMTSERAERSTFVPVTKGSSMRNCQHHTAYALAFFSGMRNVLLLVLGSLAMNVVAQPTDLIISEYIEGSANNKYIEIYNGTAANVNLGLYQLRVYTNGSSTGTAGTPAMTGTLVPGATIIYRNSVATVYTGTTVINSALSFNGNDAIALVRVTGLVLVDLVGNIGCDPGTRWGVAGFGTLDQTLVRRFSVCSGITLDDATNCPFPTLTTGWDAFPIDNISDLGTHNMDCSPYVNFVWPSSYNPEQTGAGTVPYVVSLTVSPASTGGTVVISMSSATATYGAGADYTITGAGVISVVGSDITVNLPIGATSATFTVNVERDALDEGNDLITFVLSSSTGGITLGSDQTHDFTIADDDGPPAVSFSTLTLNLLEGTSGTIFMNISPTSPNTITVQIQATDGAGVVYDQPPYAPGGDYFTLPFENVSQILTVTIPAGAASASFTFTSWNDGVEDLPSLGLETVTFTITSATSISGAAVGSPNTSVVNITDQNATPTILAPGDLVIVGVNANNGLCSGNTTEDNVSFFCFKNIARNTKLILTDNGYQRCSLNTWGNNEGTVEMTRTGSAIPAGKVITFRIRGQSGAGNVTGLAPDAGWTCNSLNGFTSIDLTTAGDQLFFMQGGIWTTNTVNGHNATYTGTPLYGFSTVQAPNSWVSLPPSCTTSSANSRSGLPLSIQCFSMAPTGSLAYNKFTFPNILTTSLSPRDWIIRADNTSNWVSPLSCAAYSAQYPNWTLSPTLNITTAPFVPGLWRGAKDTDWFECKNWDDIKVPVAITNVRIDETATRDCVVGLTPGGNATCASLLQTNSGTARNLTVQNTSSLAIGGPLTIDRTTAGTAISTTVLGNSTLSTTTLTVSAAALNQAIFRNEVPGNIVTISGNFNLGTGGYVDLQGIGVGGNIFIGGNYQNDGPTELTLDDLNGTITLNGSGAQSVGTGGFQDVFGNFTVAKSAGAVTLNNPVAVRNVLDLTAGIVNTSNPAGLLSLRAGGTSINASNTSFVNGPMQKIGNTNYSFPVGKGAVLRPCGVTGFSAASAASAFVAEYFPISAYTWGSSAEPTIDHVSQCEYWTIDRSAGAANPVVELTWLAPYSCGVSGIPDLIVARWDDAASIWRDRGNGGATGTFGAGTIPTAAIQTLFNAIPGPTPWTLASISALNPLPITLIQFNAAPEGEDVRLEWVTASERNNAYFTIERSTDGIAFESLMDVPGAMNSASILNYTELDRNPYSGLSYYRLRQTDVDGNTAYSNVVAIMMGALKERPLVAFNNGGGLTALHGFPAGSRFALQDMTGRIIVEGSTTMEGRTELHGLDLARGAYLFRLLNGDRMESAKFVY